MRITTKARGSYFLGGQAAATGAVEVARANAVAHEVTVRVIAVEVTGPDAVAHANLTGETARVRDRDRVR